MSASWLSAYPLKKHVPLTNSKSLPQKKSSKSFQNRLENQQLGSKLVQDDSPSLNNPFPTMFGKIPSKNRPKNPETNSVIFVFDYFKHNLKPFELISSLKEP